MFVKIVDILLKISNLRAFKGGFMHQNSDLLSSIDRFWEDKIVPTISEYIEIPAKSPGFDPQWKENGYLHKALHLVEKWIDDYVLACQTTLDACKKNLDNNIFEGEKSPKECFS